MAGTDHKPYYSLDGEGQPFTTLIDMTLPKGRVARHQLLHWMSAAPPCMSSPLYITPLKVQIHNNLKMPNERDREDEDSFYREEEEGEEF